MAHTYWRLYITENNGDTSYTSVNELEFRGSIGGADLCTGGAPISGPYFSSLPPSNAFDDNVSTYLVLTNPLPNYIGYQFASPVQVVQIAITATHSGEAARGPKTIAVQYSDDGTTWTTLTTLPPQTVWGTEETRVFNLPAYKFSGTISESSAITDWFIVATQCRSGALVGTTVVTGDSYTLQVNTDQPCNLTISPKVDYAWSANKVAALGDFVVASNPEVSPHLWKVTTAGTFGATESAWNTAGTTTQGTAILTYVAPLVNPVTLGPKLPTL
jgi:hypothetical protein